MEKKNLILILLSVFILIFIGTLIRTTHSGLSCPDWPLCYEMFIVLPSKVSLIQNEIPYTFNQMVYEWFHRFYAGFVFTCLLLIQLLLTLKSFFIKRDYYGLVTLTVIVILLIFQISLGGLTVMENNSSWSVGIHMSTALVIYGVLVNYVSYLDLKNIYNKDICLKSQALLWVATLSQFSLAVSGVLISTSGIKYKLDSLNFTDPFTIVLLTHIASFLLFIIIMILLSKTLGNNKLIKLTIFLGLIESSLGIDLIRSSNLYYQIGHQLVFLIIFTYILCLLWKTTIFSK